MLRLILYTIKICRFFAADNFVLAIYAFGPLKLMERCVNGQHSHPELNSIFSQVFLTENKEFQQTLDLEILV